MRGQFNFKKVVEEGYRKARPLPSSCSPYLCSLTWPLRWHWQYPGSVFRVALLENWIVVVSGRRMVEELRKRPDDELSHLLSVQEVRAVHVACGRI